MSPPDPPTRGGALLVVVVVLAGCNAAGFGAPQPYTEGGADLDGADLRAAHAAGLRDAGSFRSRTALVVRADGTAARVNRTAVVDGPANRSHGITRIGGDAAGDDGVVIETFTNRSATYRRVMIEAGSGTVVRYDAATAPYEEDPLAVRPVTATRVAEPELIATAVQGANWTGHGVERYNGTWVTRYTASGAGNFSNVRSAAVASGRAGTGDRTDLPIGDEIEVESIEATLLVTPDGVVRRLRIRLVGTNGVELTTVFSTDEVGTATVDDPAWLDEAKEETGRT